MLLSHYLAGQYRHKKAVFIATLFLLIGVALSASYFISPLPNPLYKQPLSTVIYSAQGDLMGARIAADEQWRFPSSSDLPDKYIQAVTTFEDKRFWQHIGIDPLALARAIKLNIQHERIVSGGSTITMQLARLMLGNQPRTLWQKAKEAVLALKLECQLDKNAILNHYAALAPFGGNTVGVSAANWRYFGRIMQQMSWAQAALLAVLPNSPSGLHLGKNRQALKQKRNSLLERLQKKGLLSELDLKLARLEPLPDKPKPMPRYAPHVLATLKQRKPNLFSFSTYIDLALQKHLISLTKSYSQEYEKQNIHNLSVLVIDNRDQSVVAYLGNQTQAKSNEYAQSLDIIQRSRSSGSLLKPFLFANMLQQGYFLPDSLIEDIPSFYDGYHPKNYDRHYRGVVSAKQALAQSLNVPAVRMLQRYGVSRFKDDLEAIGLSTLWRPAQDYGLSLILGGAETTLWEITNAFSRMMLSASGNSESLAEPILFANTERGPPSATVNRFPIGQGAAWLTMDALLSVNRPGIAQSWRRFSTRQNIAWKSGTSYGWHDAWAVGTNGRYTVGVWAGNANGEEARRLSGTQTAAPIMLDVFKYLQQADWPEKPLAALKPYQVCKYDGYLPVMGCNTITQWAPLEAHFATTSTYYQRIHIDSRSKLRVHGECESPDNMNEVSVFVLPPIAAFYYRQNHLDLPVLPAWRDDCQSSRALADGIKRFDLVYPPNNGKVKIPVQLDGTLGRIVLKAHHYQREATLYWHLDSQFIGQTKLKHEQAVVVNPGWHTLTVVDVHGQQVSHRFKVR